MIAMGTARRLLPVALLAGTAMASGTAHAQAVQTTIVADTGTRGTGTTVAGSGGQVLIGGGTVADSNLFHSFAEFDLGSGDTATWTAPISGSIANIINRVTGGSPSNIDGTIDTTAMPGADFWFINPDGVVFGAGASLNVPGASYFSTASEIRFADGNTFSARTPEGSTLSMANPVGFGFIGGEADAAIAGVGEPLFDGSVLPSEGGWNPTALIAPNIAVSDSALFVERLDLVATGAIGEYLIVGEQVENVIGTLTIERSEILLRPQSAEAIGDPVPSRFFAGDVRLDGVEVRSLTSTAVAGSGVFIGGNSDVSLSDSRVLTRTEGTGRGGDITLFSGNTISLAGSTINASTSLTENGGASGSIVLNSLGPITVTASNLAAFSEGSGAGGGLSVRSLGEIAIDGSTFFTGSLLPAANGGDAGDLLIFADGALTVSDSGISADTFGGGDGGEVRLLSLVESRFTDTFISAGTSSASVPATGGNVFIGTPLTPITIQGSLLGSINSGPGVGGSFNILGSDVVIRNSGVTVQAVEGATGAGGSLSVQASQSLAIANSSLVADTAGPGDGGDITIVSSGSVDVVESEFIVRTLSSGTGGDLLINAGDAMTIATSRISANTQATDADSGEAGSAGIIAGGPITITATQIESDTFGGGDGGLIRIDSGAALTIADSLVTADTNGGTGTGGLIDLSGASGVSIANSSIFTDTRGPGIGGNIAVESEGGIALTDSFVTAESLDETGLEAGQAGLISLFAGDGLTVNNSTVSTDTFGSGPGGGVFLRAGSEIVVDGESEVFANTRSSGDGGIVSLTADEVRIEQAVVSASTAGAGDSAGVILDARVIDIGAGGVVSSESQGAGAAGLIGLLGDLDTDGPSESITIHDGGLVLVRATGTGPAGNTVIRTDDLTLLRGGTISAESANALPAGFITIDAGDVLIDGIGADGSPSQIFSANTLPQAAPGGTNLGGDIEITADNLTISNGARLNSSSASANAGFITVDLSRNQGGILFLGGEERPGSILTDSGQIGSGGVITITGAYAVIADNSEISASGDVSNAFVLIDPETIRVNASDATNIVNVSGFTAVSPAEDVASGTQIVEVPFLDASEVLANRCQAARARGRSNSLQIDRIGPYSVAPASEDDSMPTDIAAAKQAGACL
ncbi:beta strand repeat-containing protein [Novosphingobium aquimarinum]|uniref:beta strand repeat-containing protein n=1 Tax=Novosphingobium aquimarinum TaxID=2682494 RepID=UPI0012EC9728|nr:filamentous hemagglutinin N-terminal domain-containing protein [Novosphingobium aquimarinum]